MPSYCKLCVKKSNKHVYNTPTYADIHRQVGIFMYLGIYRSTLLWSLKKGCNIHRLHSVNSIHIQVTICQLRNSFQYILQSKMHKFHLQTNPFFKKIFKSCFLCWTFFNANLFIIEGYSEYPKLTIIDDDMIFHYPG